MSDANIAPADHDPTVGKILPDKDFTVTDALLEDYYEGLKLDRGPFAPGVDVCKTAPAERGIRDPRSH